MRHFIPFLCVSVGLSANLCTVSYAAPSDYAYGSMARSNEVSRENSFNRYMSSSSNYNIDSDALVASLAKIFPKRSSPARYETPPVLSREERLSQYWANYRSPDYKYTPPVEADTRSPQQKLIAAATAGNTIAMWNLGHNYLSGTNGFEESADSGIYWLKTAFEHGKAEAGTALFYYFDPEWTTSAAHPKKDPVQSLYWLQKAAKAGDAEAMNIMGERVLQGAGFDPDPVEGVRLLKASLNAGHNGALISLRYAYEYGWGVPKDLTEAIKWQREAVKRGMGTNYDSDLIEMLVKADDPKNRAHTAEILDLIQANQNDQQTRLLHAKLADTGALDARGAPDPATCVALCQKLIADNDTSGGGAYRLREARFLLADHLFEGRGIAKDEIAAFELYRTADAIGRELLSARSGFYFASLLTGRLKAKNDDGTWKVIDEPEIALRLLFRAENSDELPKPMRAKAAVLAVHILGMHPEITDKGDVGTQLFLAMQYDNTSTFDVAVGTRSGWFGAPNLEKSRLLAYSAALAGNKQAQLALAQWKCEDSEGKDPEWQADIETALKDKNWDAYLWMSDQLLSGKYLPKDVNRAQELLRTAATEGNNAQAQNNLGVMLWKGTAGEKKVAEGLGWMEKALNNGFWVGGRNLAKIYHLGLDVAKDEAKAKTLLEKAGEIGGSEAAAVVAEAYQKGDIISADAQAAAQWKARANR